MNLDITKFNQVVEAAKSRTSDKLWLNAIDKAQAGIISGWWVVTELHDSVAITTEGGKTYFSNGRCQCEAYMKGFPCKHRALYRLLSLYNEGERESVTTKVTEQATREEVISSIKALWPKSWPLLADELMKRFHRNQLEMLSIDFLMAIRAVIA